MCDRFPIKVVTVSNDCCKSKELYSEIDLGFEYKTFRSRE